MHDSKNSVGSFGTRNENQNGNLAHWHSINFFFSFSFLLPMRLKKSARSSVFMHFPVLLSVFSVFFDFRGEQGMKKTIWIAIEQKQMFLKYKTQIPNLGRRYERIRILKWYRENGKKNEKIGKSSEELFPGKNRKTIPLMRFVCLRKKKKMKKKNGTRRREESEKVFNWIQLVSALRMISGSSKRLWVVFANDTLRNFETTGAQLLWNHTTDEEKALTKNGKRNKTLGTTKLF